MRIIKIKSSSEKLFLLEEFFKNQFKGGYTYGETNYFFWKLIKNKSEEGFINCYLENKKIIATASITPKTLVLNNKQHIVGEIGDTYVDKKYSGRGLFLNLVNKSLKDSKKLYFIYGTPNQLSLPIYIKILNFKFLNFLDINSYVFILSIKKILKTKIGKSLATVFDLFFKKIVQLKLFFLDVKYFFLKKYEFEEINSFNIEFDEFWNKSSKEWDFIFMRDKNMLNWRFDENPRKYHKIILKRNNDIVGYLVYYKLLKFDDSKLIIADYLFLKNHLLAFEYSLHVLKKIAFKEDLNTISLWNNRNSFFSKSLTKSFFLRNKKVPIIINSNISDIKVNYSKVHFTIADSDNI